MVSTHSRVTCTLPTPPTFWTGTEAAHVVFSIVGDIRLRPGSPVAG